MTEGELGLLGERLPLALAISGVMAAVAYLATSIGEPAACLLTKNRRSDV